MVSTAHTAVITIVLAGDRIVPRVYRINYSGHCSTAHTSHGIYSYCEYIICWSIAQRSVLLLLLLLHVSQLTQQIYGLIFILHTQYMGSYIYIYWTHNIWAALHVSQLTQPIYGPIYIEHTIYGPITHHTPYGLNSIGFSEGSLSLFVQLGGVWLVKRIIGRVGLPTIIEVRYWAH